MQALEPVSRGHKRDTSATMGQTEADPFAGAYITPIS